MFIVGLVPNNGEEALTNSDSDDPHHHCHSVKIQRSVLRMDKLVSMKLLVYSLQVGWKARGGVLCG